MPKTKLTWLPTNWQVKMLLAQEKIRAEQEAISIKAYKSRDNNFIPVFTFVRGGAQVLKKFYIANTATLREWGIPLRTAGAWLTRLPLRSATVLQILFLKNYLLLVKAKARWRFI